MGAGQTAANDLNGDYDDWGANNKVDDGDSGTTPAQHIAKLQPLDSEQFAEFMKHVDDEARKDLVDSLEDVAAFDAKTKQLVEALKHGKDSDQYNEYMETLAREDAKNDKPEFVYEGGAAAPNNLPFLEGGEVNLWIPRGASPKLVEIIEDTQFAMQAGLNSLGSGDPKSWLGFSPALGGSDVETPTGWSNIGTNHETFKQELDSRATDYTEKHKGVEITTHESEVVGKELFKQLVGFKDTLNDHYLKLDLGTETYSKQEGDKIVSKADVDKFDWEGREYQNIEKDADGKRVFYRKDIEGDGDGMTAEKGYQEGFFYLTPAAEFHFYAKHIDSTTEDWDRKYNAAIEDYQRKAHDVDTDKDGDKDKDGQGKYDEGYKAGLADGRKENPGPTTPGPTTPGPTTPGPTTPGATTPGAKTPGAGETQDFSKTFDDLLGKEDPADGTGNETGKDGKDGKDGKGGSALEQVLQPIRDAITGSGATGATAAGAPAGDGGMGVMMPMMMMGMMSQMMQQAMQQQKQDEAAERDREEREREDEEPQSAPAPNAGPAPAAPAAPPPGTTAPPVQTDAPPAPPAPDTPKSMVDMKLPDGSSQRVSSVVSEAINRELNNPNGSDARAAYQGTPGEATAGSPWVSVESSAVATGDIAQWENRSALVVLTDSGLQAIVNGQMVPLDPHNPPDGGQGGYGEFRGFFHPSGADISGTNETAVGATPPEPPAIATAAPPAAAAAPPAVPPPATMEVR